MTVEQAAEYLQVSPSTLYHMHSEGRLDGAVLKVGSTLRFHRETLLSHFSKLAPKKSKKATRLGITQWDQNPH